MPVHDVYIPRQEERTRRRGHMHIVDEKQLEPAHQRQLRRVRADLRHLPYDGTSFRVVPNAHARRNKIVVLEAVLQDEL